MATKTKSSVPSLSTAKGGTILDWPVEAGFTDELMRKVAVKRRARCRRRRVAGGTTLVAVLAWFVTFWAVPYWRDTATWKAPVAQAQTVALVDGSRVELNAQTTLQTDFRSGRRWVRLKQGEAFFSVAKDPAHPFLVETRAGTVRVTGTRFNVRLGPDQQAEVTLFEGAVQLERDHQPVVALQPGQQFESAHASVQTLSAAELENVAAWREGQFVFDGLSLAEAAARLSAYHSCHIIVAPDVAMLRAGGSFPVNDLAAVLHALETALPIRVQRSRDGSYQVGGK